MNYQVIESNRSVGSVATLCRALGVSMSGYYAWRGRGISAREQSDTELLAQIRRIQQQGRGLYGSDRITCSRKRVARLMRQHGLNSRRRRKWRHRTTDSKHNRPVAPNLLDRDFHADQINQKWVGDIVGIRTDEGWLYLLSGVAG